MKKTIVLAALLALAWARDVRAQGTQEARQEAAEDVREAKKDAAEKATDARREAGKEVREAEQDVAETRQDASKDVREAERDASQERSQGQASTQGERRKHLFEGKQNFDLDGKVQRVTGRSITITREELPPVTLRIEKYTAIELDGEKAARTQLRQGQDVQASFNLSGDKPVALELKAETNK
jgi:hypothetical protein